MMLRRGAVRGFGVGSALVVGLAVGAPVASATGGGWADDHYSLCSASCKKGAASGTIVWGNRTAGINGSVTDAAGDLHTTVTFDAYAGNTFVERQTRTASAASRSYRFAIGDPELVGGVNRVLITVCTATISGDECNGPIQELRN